MKDFESYAADNSLNIVTTTEERNGYPKNLKKAVTGFEDFEEAQRCAKETGGEICLLSKRDGHQFWFNHGWRDKPIEIDEHWFNDDTMVVRNTSASEWWNNEYQFLKDTLLSEVLDHTPTPEEVVKVITTFQAYSKLYDMIDELEENEQIYYEVGYPETAQIVPIFAMSYHDFDVTNYTIAVC